MHVEEQAEIFDIAVIGGGMVGIPLAIGLAESGFKVLLLEKFPINNDQADDVEAYNSFDGRSTALSLGSVDILTRLKLWDVTQSHANPIRTVHVSEQGRMGTTRIHDKELDLEALGYVVPNIPFGKHLARRLARSAVTFVDCAELTCLEMTKGWVELSVRSSRDGGSSTYKAQMTIAADGANSPSAAMLGIDYHQKSYEQMALIANVETELANDGVAYERFTRTGPSALLPLSAHTSALVWTLSEQDAANMQALSDAEFAKRVAELFGERLGRVMSVSKRFTYPLTLKQAKEPARSRFLVVGNAAHSLHPVAGQGFNLALRGVAGLIDGLVQTRDQGQPYWSLSCLQAIVRAHSPEQRKVVTFSDQLIDIFSPESHIPALARSVGLVALNGMAGLKAEFAKHAMGRVQRFELEATVAEVAYDQ